MRSPLLAAVTALSVLVAVSLPAAASAATDEDDPVIEQTITPSPTPTPTPTQDPIRAAEYWLDEYGVTAAWETTRGAGTTIAIIDTGIVDGPPELSGVVGGADVSGSGTADGRTPLGATDPDHGSKVASIAAGRGTGEDTGLIGVAPEASLLSISIGFGAAGAVPFTEQIAAAMKIAVDEGADVINLSFTTNTLGWDESWDEAFLYAFDHDVVVVVAAGNRANGTSVVGAPATIPGVLVVGGVDRDGVASVEASTQGITIGTVAPSEQLLGVSADGLVKTWSGTSGAAPIVAGIAALIRAAHPDLDANNVINRIIQTSRQSDAATSTPDKEYGYGLVDAEAAVTAEVPTVDENPMGDLREWIQLHRRADGDPDETHTPGAVELPEIPPADAPEEAASPLLPSAASMREVTIPLVAASAAAILVMLGGAAVLRRVRAARGRR